MYGKVTGRSLIRWAAIPLFLVLAAPAGAHINSNLITPTQSSPVLGQLLGETQPGAATADQPLRLAGAATARATRAANKAAHRAAHLARRQAAAAAKAQRRANKAAHRANHLLRRQ